MKTWQHGFLSLIPPFSTGVYSSAACVLVGGRLTLIVFTSPYTVPTTWCTHPFYMHTNTSVSPQRSEQKGASKRHQQAPSWNSPRITGEFLGQGKKRRNRKGKILSFALDSPAQSGNWDFLNQWHISLQGYFYWNRKSDKWKVSGETARYSSSLSFKTLGQNQ